MSTSRKPKFTPSSVQLLIDVSEEGDVSVHQIDCDTQEMIPAEEVCCCQRPTAVEELSGNEDTSPNDYSGKEMLPPITEPSTTGYDSDGSVQNSISIGGRIGGKAVAFSMDGGKTIYTQRCQQDAHMKKHLQEIKAILRDKHDMIVLQRSQDPYGNSIPAFDRLDDLVHRTEAACELVHSTKSTSALQTFRNTLDEVVRDSKDSIVVHATAEDVGKLNGDDDAFIGYYADEDSVAIVMQQNERREECACSSSDATLTDLVKESMSAQHQILEELTTMKPSISFCCRNEAILAVLTYPDESTAILKLPSEQLSASSRKSLTNAIMNKFRRLLDYPSEVLAILSQKNSQRSRKIGKLKSKLSDQESANELKQTLSGLTSNSSHSSIIIEGTSKNWIKTRCINNPEEVVKNLRLLIEIYMLHESKDNSKTFTFPLKVFSQVFNCDRVALPVEFGQLELIDKVKNVLDDILMPHDLEKPILIVNKMRATLEEIAYRVPTERTIATDNLWENLHDMFAKLVSDYEYPINEDLLVEAVQQGILALLDCSEDDLSRDLTDMLQYLRQLVETRPASSEQQPPIPDDLVAIANSAVGWLYLILHYTMTCIGNSIRWLCALFASYVRRPMVRPRTTRSAMISRRVSIGSQDMLHELLHERERLNRNVDHLKALLEKLLRKDDAEPEQHTEAVDVNKRAIKLMTQLLHHMHRIRTSETEQNQIHVELDSISGELDTQEDSVNYTTVVGSVRDRHRNVGVFFEARLVDLQLVSQVESEIEQVTHVHRLSDEFDLLLECCDRSSQTDEQLMQGSVAKDSSDKEVLSTGELLDRLKDCVQDVVNPILSRASQVWQESKKSFSGHSDPKLSNMQQKSSEGFTEVSEKMDSESSTDVRRDEKLRSFSEAVAVIEEESEELQHETVLPEVEGESKTVAEIKEESEELEIESLSSEVEEESKSLTAVTKNDKLRSFSEAVAVIEEESEELEHETVLPEVEGESKSVTDVTKDEKLRNFSDTVTENESEELEIESVLPEVNTDMPIESVEASQESPEKCTELSTTQESLAVLPGTSDVLLQDVVTEDSRTTNLLQQEIHDDGSTTKLQNNRPNSYESCEECPGLPPTVEVQKSPITASVSVQCILLEDIEQVAVQQLETQTDSYESECVDSSPTVEENVQELPITASVSVQCILLIEIEQVAVQQLETQTDSYESSCVDSPPSTVEENVQTLPITESVSTQCILLENPEQVVVQQPEPCSDSESAKLQLERLTTIESDLQSIRGQMEELLRNPPTKPKPIDYAEAGDLSSSPSTPRSFPCRPVRKFSRNCERLDRYRGALQDVNGKRKQCPAEITSCHSIEPNILVIHWTVADLLIDQIDGYELRIDGELCSTCYSSSRRMALVKNIDTKQEHLVAIYATPIQAIKKTINWGPALFLYHR